MHLRNIPIQRNSPFFLTLLILDTFPVDEQLIWPFNIIFQYERTYETMGGCDNYQTLNDPKRKVSFISSDSQNKQKTYTCDSSGHPEASPDWKGTNWYRFVSPAGIKVVDRPPKSAYGTCNTSVPGWIQGSDVLTIQKVNSLDFIHSQFITYPS